MAESGKAFDFSLFRRLLVYTNAYRLTFYYVAFAAIAMSILGVVQPELLQITIHESTVPKHNEDLVFYISLMVGLIFIETLFFLNEGLTVEGKPFKDFLDAKNHAEAIDYLHDIIGNNRPLSESIIKEINSLLASGFHFDSIKKKRTITEQLITDNKFRLTVIDAFSEVFQDKKNTYRKGIYQSYKSNLKSFF